jgi:hypothetical protein
MATVAAVANGIPAVRQGVTATVGELAHVVWGLLTSTNVDGAPVSFPEFAEMCVQVDGTFGTATMTLQGSNDLTSPTNWFGLRDPGSVALAFVTGGGSVQGKLVLEAPVWVRPLVSGADGTTSLNVRLKLRRQRGRAW